VDLASPPRFLVQGRAENREEWVSADLIIGADGLKSRVRRAILQQHSEEEQVVPTGDSAYRLLIPQALMLQDPDTAELIKVQFVMLFSLATVILTCNRNALRWMGPHGHVMSYPIDSRSGRYYNMVLIHPDRNKVDESWTATATKESMKQSFANWCPRFQKLLDLAPEQVPEWSLRLHKPLESWCHGQVCLLGGQSRIYARRTALTFD